MRKFELNKVVRDGVFESMNASGQKVDYEMLDESQRQPAMTDKVLEELLEFDSSGNPSELGDAFQAFIEKVNAAGYTMQEIQRLQEEKLAKLGGFAELIFVHTVELEDGDEYVPYYESNPDRFPEITEA